MGIYMKVYEQRRATRSKQKGRPPKKIEKLYKELYRDMFKYPWSYLEEASKIGDLEFIQGALENEDFKIEAVYIKVDIARFAAMYGYLNIIKYLKDYIYSYKSYVLEVAISNKQYDIVNYMLSKYSFNEFANEFEEEDYSDSIYAISIEGNLPLLKRLIEEQPYFRRFYYMDILQPARDAAMKNGHEDVTKYLDTVIAAETDQ